MYIVERESCFCGLENYFSSFFFFYFVGATMCYGPRVFFSFSYYTGDYGRCERNIGATSLCVAVHFSLLASRVHSRGRATNKRETYEGKGLDQGQLSHEMSTKCWTLVPGR